MNEQQLQQKLATLKGDILLAERQLSQLQKDIELHQNSKGKALQEFDKQITAKKKALEAAISEGARLQSLCHLYGGSLEDLQKEIEKIKNIAKLAKETATEEVKSIHEEADNRIKAVEDREKNVENREKTATERENLVENAIKTLQERSLEAEKYQIRLEEREKKIIADEEQAKQSLVKAQKLLDDRDRQLKEKTMQVQQLDETIKEKTSIAETTGKEADSRLADVKRRENLVARKEKDLHDRDIEQNQREIKLNDKSDTIRRAYQEVLSRGGTVN